MVTSTCTLTHRVLLSRVLLLDSRVGRELVCFFDSRVLLSRVLLSARERRSCVTYEVVRAVGFVVSLVTRERVRTS